MSNTSFFSNRKIGIIGYGMFGKFLSEAVFDDFQINVASPHLEKEGQGQNVIKISSNAQLAAVSDFIIPCVPISRFEEVIKEIMPQLKSGTIVMDICSVKSYPVSVMKHLLPSEIQIIASHPLFGPKPFEKKGTLQGSRMVMHNISASGENFTDVVRFFESKLIEIIEMDEEEHDKLMAGSQFFTQLVRYAAKAQDLKSTKIDTPAAQLLFEAFDNIGTSEKLLIDMLRYNDFAKAVLKETAEALNQIKLKSEKDYE